MSLTYLGHSAFEIKTGNSKILIDPFLASYQEYNPQSITDIFLTHAHGDHLGSAIDIAKRTGAVITAVFELANYCEQKGVRTNGINLGGWLNYKWGKVIATPAFHSSVTPDGVYGGCPCGYVFEIGGRTIYHAGDTCLSTEMKMIGEVYHPDLVLLPVGGQFTMDIENAATAAEWLGANKIIPMHYNTFGAIRVDIEEFERRIRLIGKLPLVLIPGEEIEIS